MLDFNRNRVYFFYFVTWISLIFLTFLVVFTTILARKSWKPKWYSWSAKKNKFKPLGASAGPSGLRSGLRSALRAPFRPPLRPSGPAEAPSGFNFFLFRTSWNHFGFKISCQNSRETTKKVKKNQWNQVTKKKRHGFPLKPAFLKPGDCFIPRRDSEEQSPKVDQLFLLSILLV